MVSNNGIPSEGSAQRGIYERGLGHPRSAMPIGIIPIMRFPLRRQHKPWSVGLRLVLSRQTAESRQPAGDAPRPYER